MRRSSVVKIGGGLACCVLWLCACDGGAVSPYGSEPEPSVELDVGAPTDGELDAGGDVDGGLAAEPLPESRIVGSTTTGAFRVDMSHVTTAFDCPPDVWCARMGNFPARVASPPLYLNSRRYGGRTGYGPRPGNQLGLSPDPSVESVVIQAERDGPGVFGLGWYYDSRLEHGVWPAHVPTANLATAYVWGTPQRIFPVTGDGYGYLRFTYVVPVNDHDGTHPGNRLGGWLTFVDRRTPPGATRVMWIGVKPFDSRNPDRTLAFPDRAVRSDRLAIIVRQAIDARAPRQFSYRGALHGPFIQFEGQSVREFQTAADTRWRRVAFRVYKANFQRALNLAIEMCHSASADRHPSCGVRTTDDWSPNATDWRLVDVHINPESPRRGVPNRLGFSMREVEGGWVN